MLNFKVKKLTNLSFSHKELLDYYENIKCNFNHLKWTPSETTNTLDHSVSGIYGWAIQTNYINNSIPCPPYHIKDGNHERDPHERFNIPTEMLFDFSQKIIKEFPDVRQLVIAGHPPGTRVSHHIDNDEFLKIHIPIKANDKSYFTFDDEKFVLEEGSAYLINTAIMHGTNNLGSTDRVHLIFKIPFDKADEVLRKVYIL